jgi:hypothetical protein
VDAGFRPSDMTQAGTGAHSALAESLGTHWFKNRQVAKPGASPLPGRVTGETPVLCGQRLGRTKCRFAFGDREQLEGLVVIASATLTSHVIKRARRHLEAARRGRYPDQQQPNPFLN